MPTIRHKRFVGMNADINPDEAPEGVLADALNVVFRRPGVAEPRPGMYGKDASDLTAINNAQNMVPYDGGVVVLDDAKVCTVPSASSASEVRLSAPDKAITPHDGYCSATKARGNLYMATDLGVLKMTSASDTTADRAGVTKGIYFLSVTTVSGYTDWWADGYVVGYRAVLRRTDANGVVTRSRPTAMFYTQNNDAADRTPQIYIDNLYDTESGDVIELYRTRSVSGDVPPYETYFAIEVVTPGPVTVIDQTTDDELGAAIFSDSLPATAPPDVAKVAALFAGSVFFGNVTGRQYKRLVMVGGQYLGNVYDPASGVVTTYGARVKTTSAVTSGSDSITVGTTDYEPQGGGIVVGQFVNSSYFPSSTRVTAVSLPTVTVDQDATGTDASADVFFEDVISVTDDVSTIEHRAYGLTERGRLAFSVETYGDLVNAINPSGIGAYRGFIIRDRFADSGQMTIKATNGSTLYEDPLPDWGDTPEAFDVDDEPALLTWSLRDRPEMFTPGVGQAWIGDQKKAIWALAAHGDRMFIFKEDGIWVLEGASERSGFRLDLLSADHRIMTPRHVCTTEIGVAAWTDAGIIIIDDAGGIDNISARWVDKYLGRFPKPSDDPSVTSGNMFYDAASNELHFIAENLSDVSSHPDLAAPMHLVWNSQTRAWGRWALKSDAIVGCSPGYESTRASFLSDFDGSTPRIWSARIPSEQGDQEYAWADLFEEDSPFITVDFTKVDDTTGYFDYTPGAEFVPAAGDVVATTGFVGGFKALVTSVDDLGGGEFRSHVVGPSMPSPGPSVILLIIRGYETTLRLPMQSGPATAEWKRWLQARWQLVGPTGLYRATAGANSTDSLADDSIAIAGGVLAGHDDNSTSTPDAPPWSPHYLFSRDHASAQMVAPYLTVREAGAIYMVAACAIQYERGSMEVSRG